MRSVDDPVEFVNLLDRMNVVSTRQANAVAEKLEADSTTVRKGRQIWSRNQ